MASFFTADGLSQAQVDARVTALAPGLAPVQSVNGKVGAATATLRVPIISAVATTWAAMPSALTELLGGALYRQAVGLGSYTKFRIIGTVTAAGFSGAVLRVYYSTNGGGAWNVAALSGADLSLTSTGAIFGAWQNIVAGAKGDVLISVFGQSGDGIVSPIIGSLSVEVA